MPQRAGLCARRFGAKFPLMEELLRSNDPVLLSFARHVLAEAGIAFLQADDHMSVLEGSLGILPRRIMVAEADLARARQALAEAEREAAARDGAHGHGK